MAKHFAQQRVAGNQVISANKDDISHTLTANHSITTIKDKRNGTHERVRSNTSVQRKFGVSADCSDCKPKLPASTRIENSIPLGLSAEDREKFITTVYEPAVAHERMRLRNGMTHGFVSHPEASTGE